MINSKSKRSHPASIASRRPRHIHTNDRPNNDRDRVDGRGSNYYYSSAHDHARAVAMTTMPMAAVAMTTTMTAAVTTTASVTADKRHNTGSGVAF